MQVNTVGRHSGERTGDLLVMRFVGQISEDDVKALHALMAEFEPEHFYMIADMTACSGLDAAARKYMAEWSKTNPFNSTSVVFGLSFATRTIVTLTVNAVKLIGRQDPELVVVKNEAEARAWIAEHRTKRPREPRA